MCVSGRLPNPPRAGARSLVRASASTGARTPHAASEAADPLFDAGDFLVRQLFAGGRHGLPALRLPIDLGDQEAGAGIVGVDDGALARTRDAALDADELARGIFAGGKVAQRGAGLAVATRARAIHLEDREPIAVAFHDGRATRRAAPAIAARAAGH